METKHITNRDIIEASKTFYGGSNRLRSELFLFIRDNYTPVEKDYEEKNGGTWHKVYCDGCDSKYTAIMIEPYQMLRRSTTFLEFYGGGVVD